MSFLSGLINQVTGQGNRSGMSVNINVIQGRNLARKDLFSKSDPYCTVSIHHRASLSLFGNTHRTSTIQNCQDPIWNQQFNLPVSNPDTDVIKIKVYDNDVMSFDDLIGEVDIPLLGLINGMPKDEWLQLQPIRGGSLHLVVTAYGFNTGGAGAPYGMGMGMGMGMPQPMPGQMMPGYPMGAPQSYGGPGYGAPGYGAPGYGAPMMPMGQPYAQPPYY